MISKPIIQNEANNHESLNQQIDQVKSELAIIEQQTLTFENTLRAHLIDQIIECQELTHLYKQIKREKKEKRLVQKKKGKNYTPSTEVRVIDKTTPIQINLNNKKELKRLYRETMLHVHPDKFSLNDEQSNLSTEITTKLIEIYQKGNLIELQSFHAHIFGGQTAINFLTTPNLKIVKEEADSYLKLELQNLKNQLEQAKNKQTYRVLIDYENPLTFIDELKEYYTDRIFKLKKRTRTK